MNKGFTLIELLAVIVILAVIALIATPIVLSIINDTKESAVIRSAEFYVDAVQNKIMQENMLQGGKLNPKECIVNLDGNVTCDGTALEVEVEGQKPNGGNISFDKGIVTNITLIFVDKIVSLNQSGELVLEDIQEPKSFSEDSWDTIAANVRAGNLSKYNVGDTKEIALTGFTNEEKDESGNNIVTYTIRIANKTNTGDVCTKEYLEKEDGTKETYSKTACGLVIEFVDIIFNSGDNAKMNFKNTEKIKEII